MKFQTVSSSTRAASPDGLSYLTPNPEISQAPDINLLCLLEHDTLFVIYFPPPGSSRSMAHSMHPSRFVSTTTRASNPLFVDIFPPMDLQMTSSSNFTRLPSSRRELFRHWRDGLRPLRCLVVVLST
ncbi:hypothetical protein M408DRAFT_218690 [Serendipita vermifera MAFF 305830]|uniref:Uncharacterized protein n=1 Tax=Serendipita vermifera MAFF 305830 TaxID=933852 RepID=A0A0C2XU67_SERVB|nr:hypothetical protein M408DRAFT_218690 [Serendipita vermifera MAFF 305830]